MTVSQGILLIHCEQSLMVREQHRVTSIHSGFPPATHDSPVRVQHGRGGWERGLWDRPGQGPSLAALSHCEEQSWARGGDRAHQDLLPPVSAYRSEFDAGFLKTTSGLNVNHRMLVRAQKCIGKGKMKQQESHSQ